MELVLLDNLICNRIEKKTKGRSKSTSPRRGSNSVEDDREIDK